MIMDALVLIVFAISIFWSMREGLALAVAGLIKGIAAVAAAWIFCDDLAVVLLKIPSVHDFAVGKISENLSVRWENSAVYEALPKLFTSNNGDFADTLIIRRYDQACMAVSDNCELSAHLDCHTLGCIHT